MYVLCFKWRMFSVWNTYWLWLPPQWYCAQQLSLCPGIHWLKWFLQPCQYQNSCQTLCATPANTCRDKSSSHKRETSYRGGLGALSPKDPDLKNVLTPAVGLSKENCCNRRTHLKQQSASFAVFKHQSSKAVRCFEVQFGTPITQQHKHSCTCF